MRPIILGPNPDALWPLLHEVSGVSRGEFRRQFIFSKTNNFTTPPVGATIVSLIQKRPLSPLMREEIAKVTWVTVPRPSGRNIWYDEPAHRLAVGLLLEELLCQQES